MSPGQTEFLVAMVGHRIEKAYTIGTDALKWLEYPAAARGNSCKGFIDGELLAVTFS